MRVLIDECLPRQLRNWLLAEQPTWTVSTVQDSGWASMKNGALLRAANQTFDVMVTADKNMHHQQNFVGLDISVLVFPTNRAKVVRAGVHALLMSLPLVRPGEKVVMERAGGADWTDAKVIVVGTSPTATLHLFKSLPVSSGGPG